MPDNPTDLEARLAAAEAAVSSISSDAILAAFDKRIAAQRPAAPTPAAAPATPAAPAAPVDPVGLIASKLNELDPGKQPTAKEWELLSYGEQTAYEDAQAALASATSVAERVDAVRSFHAKMAEGADARVERIRAERQRIADLRSAAAADRAEAIHDSRIIRQRDISQLGTEAGRLTKHELLARADELGALNLGDDVLSRAGWNKVGIEAMRSAKARLVEVDRSQISGRGFLEIEGEGGELYALAPESFDLAKMADDYGTPPTEEQAANQNQWTNVPDGTWE